MTEEHIKIFTDSLIIVKGLEVRLKNNNIGSIKKDHMKSAILSGFGSLDRSVELFILNTDLEKAAPIIDVYKAEINS